MKTFEIHITGNSSGINEEFNSLGIKNISVDLLTPKGTVLRTEHMSSFIHKSESFEDCQKYVLDLVNNLKSEVIRIKIECPYYDEYVEKSIYIESHFPDILDVEFDPLYPLSRNVKSGKIIGTDRIYDKKGYERFKKMWRDAEVELCLYDTNVNEDKDWFDLFK